MRARGPALASSERFQIEQVAQTLVRIIGERTPGSAQRCPADRMRARAKAAMLPEGRMKILLYGINFAPELTGIGKYTGEMVAWLAARGHEVRVVTAPPYYPDWAVWPGYSAIALRARGLARRARSSARRCGCRAR